MHRHPFLCEVLGHSDLHPRIRPGQLQVHHRHCPASPRRSCNTELALQARQNALRRIALLLAPGTGQQLCAGGLSGLPLFALLQHAHIAFTRRVQLAALIQLCCQRPLAAPLQIAAQAVAQHPVAAFAGRMPGRGTQQLLRQQVETVNVSCVLQQPMQIPQLAQLLVLIHRFATGETTLLPGERVRVVAGDTQITEHKVSEALPSVAEKQQLEQGHRLHPQRCHKAVISCRAQRVQQCAHGQIEGLYFCDPLRLAALCGRRQALLESAPPLGEGKQAAQILHVQ